MAIDVKDILAKLPKERREAIEARAQELIAEEVGLAELRALVRKSQAELAAAMGVQQAHVSKLERRDDLLLSTLREYVEAAGGSLEIVVRLPDRPALRLHFGSKAADAGPACSHGRRIPEPGESGASKRRRHA